MIGKRRSRDRSQHLANLLRQAERIINDSVTLTAHDTEELTGLIETAALSLSDTRQITVATVALINSLMTACYRLGYNRCRELQKG